MGFHGGFIRVLCSRSRHVYKVFMYRFIIETL